MTSTVDDRRRPLARTMTSAWWAAMYVGPVSLAPYGDSRRRVGKVVRLDRVRDFFVSYTEVNEPWAEWIAAELERAGYTTVVQAWDSRPGGDFVQMMHDGVSGAARTVAVLSPAYFASRFGESEWRAAFVKDPSGEQGVLVPVRVQPCEPPGLLASRVYIDLVDVDETTARRRLLAGVSPRERPEAVVFPGGRNSEAGGSPAGDHAIRRARFPALGPQISNLPPRNRSFSGREELMSRLYTELQANALDAVLPVGAVYGLGGVGKTQLALEFAHRYRTDFDISWWIPASDPSTAASALAALAVRIGIQAGADQRALIDALFEQLRQRDRWLLIYDNVEQPDALQSLLPSAGAGSVVLTSRWSTWRGHAQPMPVTVLARRESVQLLVDRAGLTYPDHGTEESDQLDQLAELVGDLPLALSEAAAYLEQTRIGLADYLHLLRSRERELFELDTIPSVASTAAVADQRRVATVWSVSLDHIRHEIPAAEDLLQLCAFLGSEIPRRLLSSHAELLPDPLSGTVTDALAYNRILAGAARYSLIELDPDSLKMHRLVQTVVRARLTPQQEDDTAEAAVGLVWKAFPRDSWEIAAWPTCAQVLPHLLAVCEHAERLHVTGERIGRLLNRASTYLYERGQYRQALALAERCIAVTEATLGPEHLHAAWGRGQLGVVLHAVGELPAARTQLELALQIGQAALGSDHPYVSDWHDYIGRLLLDLGELTAARTHLDHALRIGEAAHGPDHPDISAWRNDLGRVLHALGELAAARTQFQHAVRISEAAHGPDHPDVGAWRGNLGDVLQDLGDLRGARNQFEQALQISEAALGPDHPTVGTGHSNLGWVLRDLGDLSGARDRFERALQISEAALGPDHPTVGARRSSLSLALREMGDLSNALEQAERALKITLSALGPDHADIGGQRGNLGLILRELGDLSAAREQLELALNVSLAALVLQP